jgi:CheY-like chemotaxis protein
MSAGAVSVESVNATSLSILVADDDAALRYTPSRSITREGHRVEVVADGALAEWFGVVPLDAALALGSNG